MKTRSLVVLGIMTGTSCDGLDAVAISFREKRFRVLQRFSLPYPNALRKKVLGFQAAHRKHRVRDWLALNQELGVWYAKSAEKILKALPYAVDVIANHGQTLAHLPPIGTLQGGDPAYLANQTGLTVVSQFRTGDLAAGGQGAPLVPRFHQLLAEAKLQKLSGVSIHNLGGISNLTYLQQGHEPLAWDTGPANLWIDLVISRRTQRKQLFDPGGRIARQGTPHLASVKKILAHPYFRKRAPKSTGRDEFSESHLFSKLAGLSLKDALATVTLATAKSIAQDYKNQILDRGLPLSEIFVCGGGIKNTTLLECLQIELQDQGWSIPIHSTSRLGIDPQSMEAAAFAFLAKESLLGHALGGKWTGARAFGTPGQISPGRNWSSVLSKLPP